MARIVSDKPIDRREDDALGYWPFANALARGLLDKSDNHGFVVGVQANWGMGKTSAVNLIEAAIANAEIQKGEDEQTRFERFNPWQFSTTEGLAKSYLSVLGKIIANSIGEDVFSKKKSLFKRLIGGGKDLVGHAAAIGAVAGTGGAALPFMGAIQGSVSSALNVSGELTDSDSLDELARKVRERLGKLDHRIILVLDDIDRLNPHELAITLTLIKTFGDLPNVVHILLYDKSLVEASLVQYTGTENQSTYLQKIVQAEYDLPPPSRSGLLKFADNLISPVFSEMPQSEIFSEVWRLAFRAYLKSPRDIVKFYNAIAISWPSVRDEAYAPDLAAIELFRLFDRDLYNLIILEKDLLVGSEFDFEGKRLEEVAEKIKKGRSRHAARLVAGMFPRLNKGLDGYREVRPKAISEGRPIGVEAGFDTYFRMEISDEHVPVRLVQDLQRNIDDAQFIQNEFKTSYERGIDYFTAFFDEYLAIIEDAEQVSYSAFEGFLMGARFALIDEKVARNGFLFFDNFQRTSSAVNKFLSKVEKEQFRERLLAVFSEGRIDANVGAFVLAKLGEPRALVFVDASDQMDLGFSDKDVDQIIKWFAEALDKKFESREIFNSPVLWMHLKILAASQFGNDLPSRLNDVAKDPELAATIAFSAMNISTDSALGVALRMDRMPPKNVYDTSGIARLVAHHLKSFDYNQLDRQNLETFVEAVAKLEKGETPERF